MEKIYIHAIETCERRLLDAQKIYEYFMQNDYTLVGHPKKAELIFIITCAVTDDIAETTLKLIKKFQRFDAELIIGGCLPIIDYDKLHKIFNGKTISTKDINNIDNFFKNSRINFNELEDVNFLWNNYSTCKKTSESCDKNNNTIFHNFFPNIFNSIRIKMLDKHMSYWLTEFRTNHFFHIRITQGCNENCSFCAIKNAIGSLNSKPLNICLKEFKKGLKKNYKNFIILADDVGSYGIDINKNIVQLLTEIIKNQGEYFIEIREIQPKWIVKYRDDFKKILNENKISRIFSGIQSGNTRILKLMNRYNDVIEIKEAFLDLKKTKKDIAFGTECIVGFPSETWSEFQDTLEFIKDTKLDYGFIHPFSLRSNTKAEEFKPKISDQEIKNRLDFCKKYLHKNGYKIHNMFKPIIFFSK